LSALRRLVDGFALPTVASLRNRSGQELVHSSKRAPFCSVRPVHLFDPQPRS
jgi:hypothetical protein